MSFLQTSDYNKVILCVSLHMLLCIVVLFCVVSLSVNINSCRLSNGEFHVGSAWVVKLMYSVCPGKLILVSFGSIQKKNKV